MKRRPLRSQTKSVSSQPASPCSLAGAMSRLATSTKARSAKRTPLARPRYWSRMSQRPNWSNKAWTASEDRPPVGGITDLGFRGIAGLDGVVPGEEPAELGEHLDEEILASEVGDDALLDLAAFAVGFDDADVFVDGAAGGADFHSSRVHENHYHDESRSDQGDNPH